jgi:hypothetical protein
MNNRTLSVLYVAILCCTSATVKAGNEYLVPRGFVKDSMVCMRIASVHDSLRASILQLVDRINNGILHNYKDGRDTVIEDMRERHKDLYRARYNAVSRKFKLNDSTARDSLINVFNMAITEYFRSRGKYRIITGEINDSVAPVRTGIVRTSLRLLDSIYARKVGEIGNYNLEVNVDACIIVLDARVLDVSGKPLWHNQSTVVYDNEDRSMAEMFSGKNIKRAVKETFKSLF